MAQKIVGTTHSAKLLAAMVLALFFPKLSLAWDYSRVPLYWNAGVPSNVAIALVSDGEKMCVSVANSDQRDTDNDGVVNACDEDDDNDGRPDLIDAFPLDATESVDTDSDGVGNNADNCIAVSNANQLDYDSDGLGDACDDPVPLPDDLVGANAGAKTGSAVAFAGDVNGDGYGDYVVGSPGYDIPAAPPMKRIKAAGRAEVISGRDGAVLMFVNGIAANDGMGSAVAANADINNDGFVDVLVGAPLADGDAKDVGSVTVLFGPDGLTSRTLFGEQEKAAFGAALALGDLDGDGAAEMVVGVPNRDVPGASGENRRVSAGTVMVFDHNGTLVQQHDGAAARDYFGSSVAVADINNDGNADIIVGSPKADDTVNRRLDAGKVTVFSSLADHELLTVYGTYAKGLFGSAVAVGDTNGDGIADVLAGAPADKNGKVKQAGSVTVVSGSDGARLARRLGGTANANYGSRVAAGDVNGDGAADIIVGAWRDDTLQSPVTSNVGSVFVRSGADYSMLGMLYGDAANDYLGAAVSVGDFNNDGKADVIIGIPGFDAALPGVGTVKDAGMVKVLSGTGL